MEFLTLKGFYTIVHLFGVVFGAGGAFMSDAMFFSAFKDMRLNKTEMRFISIGSRMVWLGVTILLVSGYLIFETNSDFYLNSSKFLAKMTVVGIIIVNGIFLHLRLIPLCRRHIDSDLKASAEFMNNRAFMFTSGAISFVSWVSALILGALHRIPFSYPELTSVYLAVIAVAIFISNLISLKIMPRRKATPR